MSKITVKDHLYDCGKLNAMTQFHIARRLGPALIVAGISIEVLRSGANVSFEDFVGMAEPIMQFIGKMTDADADFVIYSCMQVVRRQEGSQWAPTVAGDGKTLMYEAELDMLAMLRLVAEVLKENMGNFLTELGAGPPSTSSSSPAAPSGSLNG